MKATLVLNNQAGASVLNSQTSGIRRMVFHTDGGTMIEIVANPKTGVMPKWALQLSLYDHVHVHFEDANGVLVSPGAIIGRRKSRLLSILTYTTLNILICAALMYGYAHWHIIKEIIK
jgi:hypothetical protein